MAEKALGGSETLGRFKKLTKEDIVNILKIQNNEEVGEMLLEKERLEVIEYGKRMITEGLTKGTGGNISVFNKEQGLMAITPSGIDYMKIQPEDIVFLMFNRKNF